MRCVAEYRICRKSESHYDLTEECFQGKDPSRGGPLTLTDDSAWGVAPSCYSSFTLVLF